MNDPKSQFASVKEKYIPSEKDIIQLILAADPKTDEKDLLMVILHTLTRIDEALRLMWDDINFEKRTLKTLAIVGRDGKI